MDAKEKRFPIGRNGRLSRINREERERGIVTFESLWSQRSEKFDFDSTEREGTRCTIVHRVLFQYLNGNAI